MTKLVIFDLEGPLIQTKSGQKFRVSPDDWECIPGRVEVVRALQASGIFVAGATNQSGPTWREALDTDRYPTAEDICVMLNGADRALHMPICIALFDQRPYDILVSHEEEVEEPLEYVPGTLVETAEDVMLRIYQEFEHHLESSRCLPSLDPTWRKPDKGMLKFLMDHFGVEANETLLVGDRDEDQAAALAAGCIFAWAKGYFA
jgi:histidinol phosphatase-like enzyme